MPRKRSKIIFCKNCRKDTGWYRAIFCPECVEQGWHLVKIEGLKPTNLRTIQDMIDAQSTKRHANRYNTIRLHARSRIKQLNIPLKCVNCNYDKHIEVCHIKSINTFTPDTLLTTVNDLSNLTVLCPNCHWEFDNQLITVKSISNI